MQLLDWLVIAAYLLASLGIGLYFVRRASASMGITSSPAGPYPGG